MLQNDQTHFKNLVANTPRYLKSVWPFWDIIHQRVITLLHHQAKAAAGGVIWKKVFLKVSQKSHKGNACASLFFSKLTDLRNATLFKKRPLL